MAAEEEADVVDITIIELVALVLGAFITGAVAGTFIGCYLSYADEPPQSWTPHDQGEWD